MALVERYEVEVDAAHGKLDGCGDNTMTGCINRRLWIISLMVPLTFMVSAAVAAPSDEHDDKCFSLIMQVLQLEAAHNAAVANAIEAEIARTVSINQWLAANVDLQAALATQNESAIAQATAIEQAAFQNYLNDDKTYQEALDHEQSVRNALQAKIVELLVHCTH